MIQETQRLMVELAEKCFVPVYQPQGRYVNDHCFVFDGRRFHCFYIDGVRGMGCYDEGNEIQIGHALSDDLAKWRDAGPALVRDGALAHEARGVFAPYVVRHGGEYLMFYAAHNMACAQYLCLARSKDLMRWTRHDGNPLFVPSAQWALWREDAPCSCRDAHVWFDDKNRRYVMYWVADMKRRSDLSCIAASVSTDLVHWQELGPVLIRRHSVFECCAMKTESPCLVRRHGLFYLFYRHGNGTYYCLSDDPLDFRYATTYFLGPCHAAEIFEHQGECYVSSCSRDIADLAHATDRSRGLFMARLDWEGAHPKLAAFAPARGGGGDGK